MEMRYLDGIREENTNITNFYGLRTSYPKVGYPQSIGGKSPMHKLLVGPDEDDDANDHEDPDGNPPGFPQRSMYRSVLESKLVMYGLVAFPNQDPDRHMN